MAGEAKLSRTSCCQHQEACTVLYSGYDTTYMISQKSVDNGVVAFMLSESYNTEVVQCIRNVQNATADPIHHLTSLLNIIRVGLF